MAGLPKKSALSHMVGGSHYELPIQPVEFAMTQGYDFCAASVLKYVTRHRQKNGRQDILKAIHFVQLRAEVLQKHDLYRYLDVIRSVFRNFGVSWVTDATVNPSIGHNDMDVYVAANGFEGKKEARALRSLHYLATGVGGSHQMMLLSTLQDLLDEYDEPCARGVCEHDWLPHTDGGGQHLGNVCGKCGKVG